MTGRKLFCSTVVLLAVILTGCQQEFVQERFVDEQMVIDLAGRWDFRVDPDGVGQTERWFENGIFSKSINLPGSMTENGFGDEITANTQWTVAFGKPWLTDKKYAKYNRSGDTKIAFWLQPDKHYIGQGWYRRDFEVPARWEGKEIILSFERCHWETKVWVDGKYVGVRNSLSVPHRFSLGVLKPGRHRLSVCVDNTVKINVGPDAHSVTDNTQTNWNGIIGKMYLAANDGVTIDDVQIYPDVENKTAKVIVTIKNDTSLSLRADIIIDAVSFNSAAKHDPPAKTRKVTVTKPTESFEIHYPMTNRVQLWDEFSPNLYKLRVAIEGDGFADAKQIDFGMRELATNGRQFVLNGKHIFFRGTLECCVFPLTGYPPTNPEAWERIIKIAKTYGLNHFRFHSWCPPRAAFEAADKLGFYYQIECAAWTIIGDGKPIDKFIYDEGDRILKEYGNHPSFCLMAYGNEPTGDNQKEYLGKLVDYWKAKDPRRLYTSAANWPAIAQNNYHNSSRPRMQWVWGIHSRVNLKPPETVTDYNDFISKYNVPVITHEMGMWCAYPNLQEISKYTGVLKAKDFELFRDELKENHMLDQAADFMMASGKFQALLYKEDIESALRTKDFGGYQLLGLTDYPGHGAAIIGVLDVFWDSKGYITADEYRRFSGQTVPLARMAKRVWTNDEVFKADVEIAHFGQGPITDAVPLWKITAGTKVYHSGRFPAGTIGIGNGIKLGSIKVPLKGIDKAEQLKLTVSIENTEYGNDWDFWVYPKTINSDYSDIYVTRCLDDTAADVLESGGKVLLMPSDGTVKEGIPGYFSSIFWSTALTGDSSPQTLGILCDPAHPALAKFPTEYHSNFQWWSLAAKSQPMILNNFPADFRPIVQVIDDWFTNRKLGLVFEAVVNNGKLMVCSIDLSDDLNNRPAARQMLHSLKSYMQTDAFAPKHTLDIKLIKNLLKNQQK